MQAYRRALKIASDQNRSSGSYTVTADKHIPDPTDTFAVGSPASFTGSASVTRTNQQDAQATDVAGLSAAVTQIQTSQVNGDVTQAPPIVMLSAGFRIEHNVPDNAIDKYKFIFSNTTALAEDGVSWVSTDSTKDPKPKKTCTASSCTFDQLRIQDSCIGQNIDHDSCASQSVLLVDTAACTTYCQKTTRADANHASKPNKYLDCASICGEQTHSPNQEDGGYNSVNGGAWYAANYVRHFDPQGGPNTYDFPVLENLFAFAGSGPKTMGVQTANSTAQIERASSVEKIETSGQSGQGQIQTEEYASWSDKTPKQIVTNDNLDANGFEVVHTDPMDYARNVTTTINTEVSGEVNRTLTTEK